MQNEHEQLITKCLVPSSMTGPETQRSLCRWLSRTLDLPGDVVELGCHKGNSTLALMRFLRESGCDKTYHVYDSFEGVPELSIYDGDKMRSGGCATTQEDFQRNLEGYDPVIHNGWFKDTLATQLPEQICFGFLDGDLFKSIRQSLSYTAPRLVVHGILVVHDYYRDWLPGVKKACDDFMLRNLQFASNHDGTGQLVITRLY